jgi:hypothetical protein
LKSRSLIITGSGRSGTFNLHQFLELYSEFQVFHELDFERMLKLGVLSYEAVEDNDESADILKTYFAGMHLQGERAVDVSNAGIWCVDRVKRYRKECEFLMVIRNGYKVVSSFYNKFPNTMYPEKKILVAKSKFEQKVFDFELDKKFWRPLPKDPHFFEIYRDDLRFAIICWYWSETIRQYEEQSSSFIGLMRFEDIVSGLRLGDIAEVFDLELKPEMRKFFEKPTNIDSRENFTLSEHQKAIFDSLCGHYMQKYYADLEYYDVAY